jgi:hypothetical protein
MGPYRNRLRICLNLQNFRSRDTVEVVRDEPILLTLQQIAFQHYDDRGSGERVWWKLEDRAAHHRLAILVLHAGGDAGLEICFGVPLQRAVRVEERMLERDHVWNLIVAAQFEFVALNVVFTIVEAILAERGRVTVASGMTS